MNAITITFTCNAGYGAGHFPFNMTAITFDFEHLNDVGRAVVAKELAERFFVIFDAVLFDELDEIQRRVAGEGRAAKMRIF